MDIFVYIKRDHQKIRALSGQIAAMPIKDHLQRLRLFGALEKEVTTHQKAEESVFHAFLKRYIQTVEEATHGEQEHLAIVRTMERLLKEDLTPEVWSREFHAFHRLLTFHMQDEEQRIFTTARQVLSEAEARRMVGAMIEAKSPQHDLLGILNELPAQNAVKPVQFVF